MARKLNCLLWVIGGGYRCREPSEVHSSKSLKCPWPLHWMHLRTLDPFPPNNCSGFFFFKNHTVASFFLIDNSRLDIWKSNPSAAFQSNQFTSTEMNWNDDNTKLYLDWRDGQILKGCDGNAFVWGTSAFGCVPLSSGSGNLLVLLNMICDNHQVCFLDQTTIGSNIFDDCPHLVKLCRGNLQ